MSAIVEDAALDLSNASDVFERDSHRFFVKPLFLCVVALPSLLAAIYFGLFASDIYISESRFVVRSPTRQANSALGVILNAGGFSGSSEEANAVLEYVRSPGALTETNRDGYISRTFSASTISWFDRFGTMIRGNSREHLYDFYLGKVEIQTDSALQVTRLTVRAFSPREAHEINNRLLRLSEALVNRLSARAREDAIATASEEVAQSAARAKEAAVALARYRGKEGILDPEKEAEVRLQMAARLQDELIATRTQLQQLETFTPAASQVRFLRTRIRSLEREIAQQTQKIAGGTPSLSSAVVKFQELQLNNDVAQKQLAAALGALEEARSESRRQRAYVERISEPSLPDYPREPRRIRGFFASLVLSLLVWGVLSMLIAGIREHRD